MKTALRNFFSPTSMLDTGASKEALKMKPRVVMDNTKNRIFPGLLTKSDIEERYKKCSTIKW